VAHLPAVPFLSLLADLLADHLPAVGYRPPQATYLAWLDCRKLDLPREPAEVFLRRDRHDHRVMVSRCR
jgi:bifunctional pyridoxal-dependent enzyme with beta-cystathionase and maltose regulon repressor activities